MVNRRSFLSLLAAPFIVKPTLEDIERLTWRRRFFPGYSRAYPISTLLYIEMLKDLDKGFVLAKRINRDYESSFASDAGTIITVKQPVYLNAG